MLKNYKKRLTTLLLFGGVVALTTTNVVFAQQIGEGGQAVLDFVVNAARFLAVGVGAVLIVMFGWAGFQYLTARENANQVEQAKSHMLNIVLALAMYVFGFALLNWIIPGGIVGF